MLAKIDQELSRGADISIINIVSALVDAAAAARASDIHIEPYEHATRVRFRIDGVLAEVAQLPKTIEQEIVSRIKVITGLRTDEHQATQDGRFRAIVEDLGSIDIRVSIAPTYWGENAVLRLLTDRAENFTLQTLGFSAQDRAKVARAIEKPFGCILATGPTGSGKTTTLYSVLKSLNTKEVSIVTIEDPIEYSISGIKQIQINPATGLTFASGLRSILRQDPNIIMVGEIRDAETARIAVNTALTGHLLLSTLHTSDAATTLPRLLDMGVEPFLVASTVNIAVGQRLVRKLCIHCKMGKSLSDDERARISKLLPKHEVQGQVFVPRGCDQCGGSGFVGRVSINEVLEIEGAIRDAIVRKAPDAEIKRLAIEAGMSTIIEDGFEKVRLGVTSPQEIFRVIYE